jgi:hypothetical protein
MTPEDATLIVGKLKAMYPRQEVNTETVIGYVKFLSDLDAEPAMRAVDEHIASSPWFPSVAEIRERVAERASGLPHGAAAYDLAVAVCEKRGALADLPEAVRRALDHVGGTWALRTTEDPGVLRAQFLKAYDAYRRETLDSARLGTLVEVSAPARAEIGP